MKTQSDDLMNNKPSTIIFIRGLPGSGKTYIANELKKVIGSDAVLLDPDATDYESEEYVVHQQKMIKEGVDAVLHAYRFLRGKAYKAIEEGKAVIWNQPFTNLEIFNKMVAKLRLQASEHDTELTILVVEVEVDPVLAKERVQKRKDSGGHGPSDDTFERFTRDYKSFKSDGYNTVTVYGDDDVSESVTNIMHTLPDLS